METELKLELDSGAAMVGLPALLGLDLGERHRLESIYFDTHDGRLAAGGLSLRIRSNGRERIQTVKSGGGAGAGLFERAEWEQPVEDDIPVIGADGPVAAALGGDTGGIERRFAVAVTRDTWLVDEGGSTIELAMDRGVANADGHSAPFFEVELELKAGKAEALFALARRIGAISPARIGVLSKAERGQRLSAADSAAHKASSARLSPDLTPDMTVAEGLRAVAIDCIRHFRLNEDQLRTSGAVEAIHQARVAIRRLRSALVAFRPAVRGADARRHNAELRWLAAQLGTARDIDVLLPRIDHRATRARLASARADACTRARLACASYRGRMLWIDLAEWLALGDWADRKAARRPLMPSAADALERLHRRLLSKAPSVIGDDDEARHEARKTAKKLRYAVGFFAPLLDARDQRKARKRYTAPLKDLQQYLGDLNDIAVLPATLAALGVDPAAAAQGPDVDRRSVLILRAGDALSRLEQAEPYWR